MGSKSITMRRLMKFLHTMGAIGLIGSMASLLILLTFLPDPKSLSEYALLRAAMNGIAQWIFLPSLGLTLVAGLLAIALNRSYRNSGWALIKLATGIIVFEWSLIAIQGPMQREAVQSAHALSGEGDVTTLGASLSSEWGSLWVLLAVAIANVILGVWRPRLSRRNRLTYRPTQ